MKLIETKLGFEVSLDLLGIPHQLLQGQVVSGLCKATDGLHPSVDATTVRPAIQRMAPCSLRQEKQVETKCYSGHQVTEANGSCLWRPHSSEGWPMLAVFMIAEFPEGI